MNRRRSGGIAGAGFGCTTVARQLAGRLPPEVDLTLTTEDSHNTIQLLLPKVMDALPVPEQDLGYGIPCRHIAPEFSRQPPPERPEQAHDVIRPSSPTPRLSTERAR